MLRADKPTPDAARIKTPHDTLCYAAGIPYSYWRTTFTPAFRPFKLAADIPLMTESMQQEWWAKLQTPDLWLKPHLVYVCCAANESRALEATFDVARAVLRTGRTIHVDYVSEPDPVQQDPVAVLTGVSAEMTVDRRQAVRDWVNRRKGLFRLVAVEGTPDAIMQRLGIQPTLAFDVAHIVVRA